MDSAHSKTFDVLVVGGGPAGMAAARAAASSAGTVGIVDDNPKLGGQIWRGQSFAPGAMGPANREAATLYRAVHQAGILHLPGHRIFDQLRSGVLLAERMDVKGQAEGHSTRCELHYRKLILATGARERFLPFPGWTLRNVMGAGALQAMAKCGLPIAGKRIVVAGSGPLLLAVAAYLRNQGGSVLCVCEQAPATRMARFAATLIVDPSRLAQGLAYRKQLRGTPYRFGWWPLAAYGKQKLETVVLTNGRKAREVPCDYLACGFHLVPNTELAALLRCKVQNGSVVVDRHQQTTEPNIFCAGEPTGIGGLEQALLEGEIAGLASAERIEEIGPLLQKQEKLRRFAERLEQSFALRKELRNMPTHDTVLCRCEDVLFAEARPHSSWRAAKLQTRCGMGPCQGRICGPAVEFLFGWKVESVRPPIQPVMFDTMMGTEKRREENP